MLVVKTVVELQQFLSSFKHQPVGFVPTMGALHQGHLSLIEKAIAENDIVVVSIFVNPTQFNNKEDLEKYPRHTEKDIALINDSFNNYQNMVVFLPDVKEVYPHPVKKSYDFGNLSLVMEAQHRPGHFDGVGMVLERFFEMIHPTKAYFGEKDFQQLAVVRNLAKQLKLNIEIIGCPIIREINGLAMSSRNERLKLEQKEQAANIYRFLQEIQHQHKSLSVDKVKQNFIAAIKTIPALELEYFEITDGNTLLSINDWEETSYCVAFVAVFIDGVRLIDNITLYRENV